MGRTAMSEEHNTDEMDDTERTIPVNRRNFVKSLSAAGIAGAFGATGTSIAAAKKSANGNPEFDHDDLMSHEQIRTDLQSIFSTKYAAQLKQRLIDKGVVPHESDAIGIDSSIDARTAAQQLQEMAGHGKRVSVGQIQRINRLNPVTVLLPFSSEDGSQAGLLTVLVADNQEDPNLPERVPLTMFGLLSGDSSGGSSYAGDSVSAANIGSNATTEVKEFTWDGEKGGVTQSNQVEISPADFASSNGQISTSGAISCAGCLALVGYVCANPGIIGSILSCGRYCIRAIAASIFAAAACQAACTALFVAISSLGCGVTGAALCASTPLC